MEEEDKWTQFKEDGTFLIEWSDFLNIFTELVFNRNIQKSFNTISFKGLWNQLTPGLPS